MSEKLHALGDAIVRAFPQADVLRTQVPQWVQAHGELIWLYTGITRLLFPLLALLILVRAIRGLLRIPTAGEVWGQLALPGGGSLPIRHWENILGRAPLADLRLDLPTVSRQHAALVREENGQWRIHDLGSKAGTLVNDKPVEGSAPLKVGDALSVGGVKLLFLPLSRAEEEQLLQRRRAEAPLSMVPSLLWLTLFQILAAVQLFLASGGEHRTAPLTLLVLTLVMWVYYGSARRRLRGFELETIAFFLSTLSLAVTASSAPEATVKQLVAILLGLLFLSALTAWMADPARLQKLRWLMAALAIGLLSVTLVLGRSKFGAANWIILGPFSFQPSEIAKIFYIFAGSATLERLFRRRNLGLFMVLTGVCLLCLALMSDFGTACIFFATFLVIAYLRSGDFATLSLLCGGAAFAGLLVLRFKPYIFRRFASWGHAWQAASTTGYQQTRAMSAAASGGLVGMGAGNGWLQNIPAADTDLVFGMLCEEWGLLIAVLAVLSILTLTVFAARACRVGRSAFPTIAACAAIVGGPVAPHIIAGLVDCIILVSRKAKLQAAVGIQHLMVALEVIRRIRHGRRIVDDLAVHCQAISSNGLHGGTGLVGQRGAVGAAVYFLFAQAANQGNDLAAVAILHADGRHSRLGAHAFIEDQVAVVILAGFQGGAFLIGIDRHIIVREHRRAVRVQRQAALVIGNLAVRRDTGRNLFLVPQGREELAVAGVLVQHDLLHGRLCFLVQGRVDAQAIGEDLILFFGTGAAFLLHDCLGDIRKQSVVKIRVAGSTGDLFGGRFALGQGDGFRLCSSALFIGNISLVAHQSQNMVAALEQIFRVGSRVKALGILGDGSQLGAFGHRQPSSPGNRS